MQYDVSSLNEYLESIPVERKEAIEQLIEVLKTNLPDGFALELSYGHLGFVVPHTLYPSGYHCDPKAPLPFINIASQKNFIALYHMGLYMNDEIYNWFVAEYPKHSTKKLDMGKSCIRFKKVEDIPYDLIRQLAQKITPEQWINMYESVLINRKK
ncbi:protein of unknown function (DU1801) [Algoriella xinjiangensis]|uniref:YdhG-like domain-containing protein n=1 Tax=Algoriella xinjiangensis TaxID=684065 RepID=A0A1I4S7L0_9FLAO|nr:DUF1801 domain-containing protein [Algoriella xinjiangensis]SFM60260.1 protein of unknown function (DU1801) [Algoriella xinjiangensis]VDH15935.1 Domain of uncharacterised function (DU1801) [Algoriella xinjiangensis]